MNAVLQSTTHNPAGPRVRDAGRGVAEPKRRVPIIADINTGIGKGGAASPINKNLIERMPRRPRTVASHPLLPEILTFWVPRLLGMSRRSFQTCPDILNAASKYAAEDLIEDRIACSPSLDTRRWNRDWSIVAMHPPRSIDDINWDEAVGTARRNAVHIRMSAHVSGRRSAAT